MKKTHFAKYKIKDTTLRRELVRAHGMILLLVIALMATLALSSALDIVLDPVLTFIAVFLLAIVGLISLMVVISILRVKK